MVQSAASGRLMPAITRWMMTPAMPESWSDWTWPCQQAHARRELPASWQALCFYPPTVYVTARRPRKPRSIVAPPSRRRLTPVALLTFFLPCFVPAINSTPLPEHPEFDRLQVVLVAPRNPLNIGAAARAMSNFGFLHLRIVNPYELAFREARSAVGAEPLLARAEEFKTIAEAIEDCTLVVGTTSVGQRQLQHPVHRLDQATHLIRRHLASGRVALLFGSEKRGLSNEDLSHCHWLLRIPTREEHRSMNLGQAVAVCLYELDRDSRGLPKPGKHVPAGAADLERLTTLLLDALRSSGYLKSNPSGLQKRRTGAPTEEKIRRLVHRLHLSASDAELTLGILRQIFWKLASTKAPPGENPAKIP
jgi:TrmH family RNA methyltransferase